MNGTVLEHVLSAAASIISKEKVVSPYTPDGSGGGQQDLCESTVRRWVLLVRQTGWLERQGSAVLEHYNIHSLRRRPPHHAGPDTLKESEEMMPH